MTPPDGAIKTDRILDELKRRQQVQDLSDVEEEQLKVVVFTCGGVRYGFLGAKVREILPPREISWVPCLPDHLPGLVNVRGDIEAVVDIRLFLGLERGDLAKCLIAMVVEGNCRFGVLIDAVEEVADVPASAIRPPLSSLSGSARELVQGELEMPQGLVILLDVEKLTSRIRA